MAEQNDEEGWKVVRKRDRQQQRYHPAIQQPSSIPATASSSSFKNSQDLESSFYRRSYIAGTLNPYRGLLTLTGESGKVDLLDGLAGILRSQNKDCYAVEWLPGRLRFASNYKWTDEETYLRDLLQLSGKADNFDRIQKLVIEHCREVLTWRIEKLSSDFKVEFGNLRTDTDENTMKSLESVYDAYRFWGLEDGKLKSMVRKVCGFRHGINSVVRTGAWSSCTLEFLSPSRKVLTFKQRVGAIVDSEFGLGTASRMSEGATNKLKDAFEKEVVKLHAEMALVEKIVAAGDKQSIRCIGISKASCYLCYKTIQLLNGQGYKIRVKASHMKHYILWKLPQLKKLLVEALINESLADFAQAVQDHLDGKAQVHADYDSRGASSVPESLASI